MRTAASPRPEISIPGGWVRQPTCKQPPNAIKEQIAVRSDITSEDDETTSATAQTAAMCRAASSLPGVRYESQVMHA